MGGRNGGGLFLAVKCLIFVVLINKDMKKLFVAVLFIAGVLGAGHFAQAQTLKFGHINSMELMQAMPETDSAQAQLQAYAAELENTIKMMQTELENKQMEFRNGQSQWSDLIRATKERELQDMYARTQEFMTQADEDYKAKSQALLAPITEKAKKAIDEVAREGKFSYIFDTSSGVVLYGTDGDDILDLVKKKMGL